MPRLSARPLCPLAHQGFLAIRLDGSRAELANGLDCGPGRHAPAHLPSSRPARIPCGQTPGPAMNHHPPPRGSVPRGQSAPPRPPGRGRGAVKSGTGRCSARRPYSCRRPAGSGSSGQRHHGRDAVDRRPLPKRLAQTDAASRVSTARQSAGEDETEIGDHETRPAPPGGTGPWCSTPASRCATGKERDGTPGFSELFQPKRLTFGLGDSHNARQDVRVTRGSWRLWARTLDPVRP